MTNLKCLNIGMYGCGTVGTGVYNILVEQTAKFQQRYGLSLKIIRICARQLNRPRPDLKLQSYTSMTSNIDDIMNDSSIHCVLELIGGTTLAKDIVFRCIEKGKHVITANKALVATHMDDIISLLHKNPSIQFGCEAAVCGGIPIINTIQESFIGDEITEIAGILNGTTNYMLSKMENTKAKYEDVLKEAQELGYAEADPTADVDGYDAQAKIAILCKLAFGVTMPLDKIYTLGIRNIKPEDFEYAQMLKSSIKLLGIAKSIPSEDDNEENEKIIAYVSPMIVSIDSIIAKTTGARNMVHISSKNCGKSALLGEGAGRYPTANSVVSDILQLARHTNKNSAQNPLFSSSLSKYTIVSDYPGQFYIRVTVADGLGIIAKMGKIASDHTISIYAILQAPIKNYNRIDFVITTEKTYLRHVKAMCEDIRKESFVLEDPLYLPIH